MLNNNYWEIPSVRYRHRIRQLTSALKILPYFSGIAIGIVVKSGRASVLSSTPRATLEAIKSGFSRSELLLDYDYLKGNRFISPKEFEDIDLAQSHLKKILNKYQVYRGYCYTRSSGDCRIIVAFNTKVPISNHKELYEQTKSIIKPFTIGFIDDMLDVYLTELPELKHSRFATDISYRHRILDASSPIPSLEYLSNQEIAILYWAARGKSATETATILNLSKNTIDSYRRDILQKLDVNNITQAVHLAIQANMIV